jgi:hypothetical protein
VLSINVLPDEVLLTIFDCCAGGESEDKLTKNEIEAWQSLAHVCRRWRGVVFESPRRLNLRLVCTSRTPVREMLDVWPAFPLLIQDRVCPAEGVDNIVAVLERNDRVDKIELFDVSSTLLEKGLAALQEPFPELVHLVLLSYNAVPVLPDSFLGGSAPRLQFLWLDRIPIPGLPKLLSSATHLVTLRLENIPHSGYFPPNAMVMALSTLTALRSLRLGFQSPQSHPDQESRRPPPLTRSVLPDLTFVSFKGVSEYLEDLVSSIDAPQLNHLIITFFNQIIFNTPQFTQFISRTPTLKALKKARVAFAGGAGVVNLSSQTSGYGDLELKVPCRELDWQVSSLVQVCTSLPPLSTLEDLYIYAAPYWQTHWKDNVENVLWLELLHPFTAVKNLYLSKEFPQRITPALRELIGGRTTEVLPTLQNIFLEVLQPPIPDIQKFIAARQVTGHPIVVSSWDNSKQDKVLGGR